MDEDVMRGFCLYLDNPKCVGEPILRKLNDEKIFDPVDGPAILKWYFIQLTDRKKVQVEPSEAGVAKYEERIMKWAESAKAFQGKPCYELLELLAERNGMLEPELPGIDPVLLQNARRKRREMGIVDKPTISVRIGDQLFDHHTEIMSSSKRLYGLAPSAFGPVLDSCRVIDETYDRYVFGKHPPAPEIIEGTP